jgi:CHASE2 domain-containing sensor protein
MRQHAAFVLGIVFACAAAPAPAAGARDAEWARGIAAAIGVPDEPRVDRVTKDSPRGVAVRVLLPGLSVERARFKDGAAARRYAQDLTIEDGVPTFIEVRAEQVVVLVGALVDGRSSQVLAERAWAVLSGPRETGDIRTSWNEPSASASTSRIAAFASGQPTIEPSAAGPVDVVVLDIEADTQQALGAAGPSLYAEHHARLLLVLEAAGARGVGFTLPVSLGEATPETRAFVAAARATRLAIVVSERLVENDARTTSAFDTKPEFKLLPAGADVRGEARIGRATQLVSPEVILPAETPRTFEELKASAKMGDLMLVDRVFPAGGPTEGLEPVALALLARAGALPDGSPDLFDEFLASASFWGTRGVLTEERLRGVRTRLADAQSIAAFRYADAVAGRVDPRALRGAFVFVGSTDPEFGRAQGAANPGALDHVSVYVHAMAARRLLAASTR